MKFWNKILLPCMLILLLLVKEGLAQPKCRIEHFSTEDGLSHDLVSFIMKDSEGFMWFGTWDGVNRFDGQNFVSYKSSPGDMSEFKNDRIDQIVEDRSNHLWLKAYDGDIYRFNKATEKFTPLSGIFNQNGEKRIPFDRIVNTNDGDIWLLSKKNGLCYFAKSDTILNHFTRYNSGNTKGGHIPSNDITIFYEDHAHNIWLATPKGLACMLRSPLGDYRESPIQNSALKSLDVKSITEDERWLYFGTRRGELITYNKSTGQFSVLKASLGVLNALCRSKKNGYIYATSSTGEVFTIDPRVQKIISVSINPAGALYSIFEDSKGFLWIAPEQQGVIRFDPLKKTFQQLSQKSDFKRYKNGGRFKVLEDNNGIVWVSMKGGGFGYYNATTRTVDYFYNEPGTTNRKLSNTVIGFFYDPAGVFWLNTDERGIDKVVLQPDEFKLRLFSDPGVFKADNEARGILCDSKNRLWFGVKSGKLNIYKDNKLVNDILLNEPPGGLGLVYTMIEDSKGNVWLGTKNNGLFRAEPVNPERTKYHLSHFISDKNDVNSLSSNEIYGLVEDRQGRIWVGSYDGGLNLMTGTGTSVKFIRAGTVSLPYPKNTFNKIRHLALDGLGNIWVATTDGLLILAEEPKNPSRYQYVTYHKIPGDKESLGNNDIQYILRDTRNIMWLATSGGGLDRALGDNPIKSLKFRDYTTKDGLPNDYVLSCIEDKRGYLWVATQNGLSKFKTVNSQFVNYDSYDGLPKTTFSEASSTKSGSNNLIFGTVKGYLTFDPESIINHRISSRLIFTNLQINNKDMSNSPGNAILYTNINYAEAIKLNYDQNTISLDYVVLDPRSSSKQIFAYRLKGLDHDWQDNKTQRRITYTNLAPGNYTLEVKCMNTALFLKAPYRTLRIIILPPLWRTWWAYILYAIITFLIGLLIVRTAMTLLKLRQNIALEKRLTALKMSFFTNVSHELRTPLTLILNPIEEIEKILLREKTSQQGIDYVRIVKKNANRMVRFINQLLDLRKVQSGKARLKLSQIEIVAFTKNIAGYFKEIAREKNVDLEIISNDQEIFGWIDAEKLDIVIYNVLANAYKFTPHNKHISIAIHEDNKNGTISVSVRDQGNGVAASELQSIFDLYFEGEHSDVQNQKGTGIGLALSKELIQLHHGNIHAQNNDEGGLTVTIEINSGKAHFDHDQVDFADQLWSLPEFPGEAHETLAEPTSPKIQLDENSPIVLLVEDNSELRTFLTIQLSEYYRVITANNGNEGLQMAVQLLPDLILSDVMMPVMNGIEMLDHLKRDSLTSHIPVIILSAKSSIESQIEGLKYGADYYITKPFNNAYLLTSIENLLEKRKQIFERLLTGKKVMHLSPGEIAITTDDEKFLKRIIEIVENNIGNMDFNVDSAADLMNMSRSAFFKKFKSLTNQVPVDFVKEMRLKRAKQYFDAGQTKISDISFEVGFINSKYFSTCFKEQFGFTPSEYLKSKERSGVN